MQKYFISILIITIFILGFPLQHSLAQGTIQSAQVPQTLGEAKSIGIKILEDLPGQMKKIWQEEAWPIFKRTWQRLWGLWKAYIWPKIEPYWQKFLGFLGKEVEKRKPIIGEEFQKEKEEMKQEIKEMAPEVGKSLWERFRALLK